MRKALNVALTLALLAAPEAAQASGFKVNEQDTKAAGMANAFAGLADDPGTIGLNLAGIGQLDGTQASLTFAGLYVPGREFESYVAALQNEQADDQWAGVPSFYVTSDLGSENIHVGLGVYSMFGLTQDWDATGRVQTPPPNADGFSEVADRVKLQTLFINPVVAYDFMDGRATVAAGFIAGWSQLKANTNPLVPRVGSELADTEQLVNGWDYSFNVGVHANLGCCENIHVGAYYRHKMDLDLSGHFEASHLSPLVFRGQNEFATPERTRLTLPGTLAGGIAYDVNKHLTVEIDGEYNFWSQFDEVDSLIDHPLLSAANQVVIGSASLSRTPDWRDSWAVRLGVQYKLNNCLSARAGYFFDSTPVPRETLDPTVPDGDRNGITVGASYNCCHWSIDLAYMLVGVDDREVNNTVLAGAGIAQQFGKYSSDPVEVLMLTFGVRY